MLVITLGDSGSGSMVSEGIRTTLTSLTPWTNYTISVAASTRAGEGVASQGIVCTTDQDGESTCVSSHDLYSN